MTTKPDGIYAELNELQIQINELQRERNEFRASLVIVERQRDALLVRAESAEKALAEARERLEARCRAYDQVVETLDRSDVHHAKFKVETLTALSEAREEIERLMKVQDAMWDGEFDCPTCGRMTGNGVCTGCSHGTSPIVTLRADLTSARQELTRAYGQLRSATDSHIEKVAYLGSVLFAVRECLQQNEDPDTVAIKMIDDVIT